MNTHRDSDSYVSPSITILGSLADLTQGEIKKPKPSGWGQISNFDD